MRRRDRPKRGSHLRSDALDQFAPVDMRARARSLARALFISALASNAAVEAVLEHHADLPSRETTAITAPLEAFTRRIVAPDRLIHLSRAAPGIRLRCRWPIDSHGIEAPEAVVEILRSSGCRNGQRSDQADRCTNGECTHTVALPLFSWSWGRTPRNQARRSDEIPEKKKARGRGETAGYHVTPLWGG